VNGVSTQATTADVVGTPALGRVQVWTEYAVVSNDERKRMGKAPRDMLIEQVQTSSVFSDTNTIQQGTVGTPPLVHHDIHFSHAIKALFFGLQNSTNPAEWSNYTAASPVPTGGGVQFNPSLAGDPIAVTSLIYESTQRLSMMGSDYFSLVHPFYHSIVVAQETGYHMYAYTLDLVDINPQGSTNYGKLTNVSFEYFPSASAIIGSQSTGTVSSPYGPLVAAGAGVKQQYSFVVVAVNHNITRVSGGALGFPVL
jgi:hypothetical protein